MSTATTPLQAAHTAKATKLRAELRSLLQRHLQAAHAIRTHGADASAGQVRAYETTFESTFEQIAARVDELRKLEHAAEWISDHAHLVHVEGNA